MDGSGELDPMLPKAKSLDVRWVCHTLNVGISGRRVISSATFCVVD